MEFYLLSNNTDHVSGVATVQSRFRGHVHSHAEPERYVLLSGMGILRVNGINTIMREGDDVTIPGGSPHAFITLGRKASKLFFEFGRGPLASIKYTYTNTFLRPTALKICYD